MGALCRSTEAAVWRCLLKAGLVVDDEAAVPQQQQGELPQRGVITTQIPAYQAAALRQNAGDEARDRNSSSQRNVRCACMLRDAHSVTQLAKCAWPWSEMCHSTLCRSARHENINRRLQQSAELLSSAHLRAQKQEQKLKSRKASSARVYVL